MRLGTTGGRGRFEDEAFGISPFGIVGLFDVGSSEVHGEIAAQVATMTAEFDQGIAQFLSARQVQTVTAMLRRTTVNDSFRHGFDREAIDLLRDRAADMLKALLPKGTNVQAIVAGVPRSEAGAQVLQQRVQMATQIANFIEPPDATAAGQAREAIAALRNEFDQVSVFARRFGIDLELVRNAFRERSSELRKQLSQPVREFIAAGRLNSEALRINQAFEALAEKFREVTGVARALGMATAPIAESYRQQRAALREQIVAPVKDFVATGRGATQATQLRSNLDALTKQFLQLMSVARATGLALDPIRNSFQSQRRAMLLQARQPVQDFIAAGDAAADASGVREAFAALATQFREVTAVARELGMATAPIARSYEQQRQALARSFIEPLEQQEKQIADRIRAIFESALDPLKALKLDIATGLGGTPATQLRETEAEFARLQRAVEGGQIELADELAATGQALIERSGAYGAGPGQAQAAERVESVLDRLIPQIEAQRDKALKDLPKAVERGSAAEVKELREQGAETRAELRLIRKELAKLNANDTKRARAA
jgi:hypothetical protein